MSLQQIFCRRCQTSRWTTSADRLQMLQSAGHLRKVQDPTAALVAEMFVSLLPSLPCWECRLSELSTKPSSHSSDKKIEEDDEAWGATRKCVDCKKTIDPERLELFPKAERCVTCQRAAEQGGGNDDQTDSICPRCGNYLSAQRTRSSLSTYRLVCRDCGYAPKR